jgi:hypothetical protein
MVLVIRLFDTETSHNEYMRLYCKYLKLDSAYFGGCKVDYQFVKNFQLDNNTGET